VNEQRILALLAEAFTPRPPAADRSHALRERILKGAARTPQAAPEERFVTIPASAGDWVETSPGILRKYLHNTEASESYLVRIRPGACLPGHPHPGDETCLVLEGETLHGESRLKAGDFHLARAGTRHCDVFSDQGALLLIHAQHAA
jgi:quercetin dioxygenase-like cupin family protein